MVGHDGIRVLVCPTAFKGSLGAGEVAEAMAEGVRRARPEASVIVLPLSDGGPGLLDALRATEDGDVERCRVSGPLGGTVDGRILWSEGRVAVIESADACGLHLVPEDGRPMEAHTQGVGELVAKAVESDAASVRVGLGGSATTDGGTGLARAFGYRFLDAEGEALPRGGSALRRLARIEPGKRPDTEVVALADVETTLTGMKGAARAFGPQKGASREQVELLVEGLERLADRLVEDLGARVADLPGSGAAGGLGAGCAAFLGARIVSGADWVLERVGFQDFLTAVDLVMTGEGVYDASSEAGKITASVLERALTEGVATVVVAGRIESELPDGARGAEAEGRWLDARAVSELAAATLEGFRGSGRSQGTT